MNRKESEFRTLTQFKILHDENTRAVLLDFFGLKIFSLLLPYKEFVQLKKIMLGEEIDFNRFYGSKKKFYKNLKIKALSIITQFNTIKEKLIEFDKTYELVSKGNLTDKAILERFKDTIFKEYEKFVCMGFACPMTAKELIKELNLEKCLSKEYTTKELDKLIEREIFKGELDEQIKRSYFEYEIEKIRYELLKLNNLTIEFQYLIYQYYK
ncbi:hypothetical protein [Clostridium perfringens]|uniref:hypothetical protein n=1 Tax=Clostridium perfringens TaxID=1502 RepID=UPI0018E4BA90|nr:hypothetical protein [Clostridium perfringens]MBI5998566.1 hypothetical protein [Clostridium perfringens]